jgi:hypothetical protein
MKHHRYHDDFSRPVFVDDSGRRCSIVRNLGRAIAAVAVGFVALGAAALTVSPSVSASRPLAATHPQAIGAAGHASKQP